MTISYNLLNPIFSGDKYFSDEKVFVNLKPKISPFKPIKGQGKVGEGIGRQENIVVCRGTKGKVGEAKFRAPGHCTKHVTNPAAKRPRIQAPKGPFMRVYYKTLNNFVTAPKCDYKVASRGPYKRERMTWHIFRHCWAFKADLRLFKSILA